MALTRAFRETVIERVEADPAFARALLAEGVQALLAGDTETGKRLVRHYINATAGFAAVAGDIGKDPKSVMRMLGPDGNPNARNLFALLGSLQRRAGISLEVTASDR